METQLGVLAARLVLAAVFGTAGVTKLLDYVGTRQSVREFGVPAFAAPIVAALLPLAELSVAVLLVITDVAVYGASAALALLAAFLAAIALNLVRGSRPTCRCFGQIGSGPIGGGIVARNLALSLVAALAVWLGPGVSLWQALATLGPADRLALALAALTTLLGGGLVWLIAEVVKQNGRMLVRLDALEARLGGQSAAAPGQRPELGLPIGTAAPRFDLPDHRGELVRLDDLLAGGRPVALLFTDPDCGPCNDLLPEVGAWRATRADLTIAVISRGEPEANRRKSASHGLGPVLIQRDFEVAERFRVNGTPAAVLIRPDGTVGSRVAMAADDVRALIREWGAGIDGRGARTARPPQAGDPAPPIELSDLDGRTRRLSELAGRTTLVLFWDPSCGFCERMLPALKGLERTAADQGHAILVVSRGTAEANRALDLRSTILLDGDGGVMRRYGVRGTPMAVLVDGVGRIASDVVAGADAISRLAGGMGSDPR
ncbi:MAG: TlpA family protein disulfide reductase [Chloroflexota bacterium]